MLLAEGKNDTEETKREGMRQISRQRGDDALGELDNEAPMGLLLVASGHEGRTSSVLEDFSDALTSPCRALQIVPGADLLSHGHTLRVRE